MVLVTFFYIENVHNYHFAQFLPKITTKRKQNKSSRGNQVYTLSFLPILLVQSCKFMHHFFGNRRTFAVVILQDDTETKYSH